MNLKMIEVVHYDDGRQKWQSHEVYLREDNLYNKEYDVFSHNPFDITGYGATKEEAFEDFIRKFTCLMAEWRGFEKILGETDYMFDNMVEVDCCGKKVK